MLFYCFIIVVEFEKFLYLIYVLVCDFFVIGIVKGGDCGLLNVWLECFVDEVGVFVIYFMDLMGLMIVVFNYDYDVIYVG